MPLISYFFFLFSHACCLFSFHAASIFHGISANAPPSMNIDMEQRRRGADQTDTADSNTTMEMVSFLPV